MLGVTGQDSQAVSIAVHHLPSCGPASLHVGPCLTGCSPSQYILPLSHLSELHRQVEVAAQQSPFSSLMNPKCDADDFFSLVSTCTKVFLQLGTFPTSPLHIPDQLLRMAVILVAEMVRFGNLASGPSRPLEHEPACSLLPAAYFPFLLEQLEQVPRFVSTLCTVIWYTYRHLKQPAGPMDMLLGPQYRLALPLLVNLLLTCSTSVQLQQFSIGPHEGLTLRQLTKIIEWICHQPVVQVYADQPIDLSQILATSPLLAQLAKKDTKLKVIPMSAGGLESSRELVDLVRSSEVVHEQHDNLCDRLARLILEMETQEKLGQEVPEEVLEGRMGIIVEALCSLYSWKDNLMVADAVTHINVHQEEEVKPRLLLTDQNELSAFIDVLCCLKGLKGLLARHYHVLTKVVEDYCEYKLHDLVANTLPLLRKLFARSARVHALTWAIQEVVYGLSDNLYQVALQASHVAAGPQGPGDLPSRINSACSVVPQTRTTAGSISERLLRFTPLVGRRYGKGNQEDPSPECVSHLVSCRLSSGYMSPTTVDDGTDPNAVRGTDEQVKVTDGQCTIDLKERNPAIWWKQALSQLTRHLGAPGNPSSGGLRCRLGQDGLQSKSSMEFDKYVQDKDDESVPEAPADEGGSRHISGSDKVDQLARSWRNGSPCREGLLCKKSGFLPGLSTAPSSSGEYQNNTATDAPCPLAAEKQPVEYRHLLKVVTLTAGRLSDEEGTPVEAGSNADYASERSVSHVKRLEQMEAPNEDPEICHGLLLDHVEATRSLRNVFHAKRVDLKGGQWATNSGVVDDNRAGNDNLNVMDSDDGLQPGRWPTWSKLFGHIRHAVAVSRSNSRNLSTATTYEQMEARDVPTLRLSLSDTIEASKLTLASLNNRHSLTENGLMELPGSLDNLSILNLERVQHYMFELQMMVDQLVKEVRGSSDGPGRWQSLKAPKVVGKMQDTQMALQHMEVGLDMARHLEEAGELHQLCIMLKDQGPLRVQLTPPMYDPVAFLVRHILTGYSHFPGETPFMMLHLYYDLLDELQSRPSSCVTGGGWMAEVNNRIQLQLEGITTSIATQLIEEMKQLAGVELFPGLGKLLPSAPPWSCMDMLKHRTLGVGRMTLAIIEEVAKTVDKLVMSNCQRLVGWFKVLACGTNTCATAIVELQMHLSIMKRCHELLGEHLPLCCWDIMWACQGELPAEPKDVSAACSTLIPAAGDSRLLIGKLLITSLISDVIQSLVLNAPAQRLERPAAACQTLHSSNGCVSTCVVSAVPEEKDRSYATWCRSQSAVDQAVSSMSRETHKYFGTQHLDATQQLVGTRWMVDMLEALAGTVEQLLEDNVSTSFSALSDVLLPGAYLKVAEWNSSPLTAPSMYQHFNDMVHDLFADSTLLQAAMKGLHVLGNTIATMHLVSTWLTARGPDSFMQVAPLLGIWASCSALHQPVSVPGHLTSFQSAFLGPDAHLAHGIAKELAQLVELKAWGNTINDEIVPSCWSRVHGALAGLKGRLQPPNSFVVVTPGTAAVSSQPPGIYPGRALLDDSGPQSHLPDNGTYGAGLARAQRGMVKEAVSKAPTIRGDCVSPQCFNSKGIPLPGQQGKEHLAIESMFLDHLSRTGELLYNKSLESGTTHSFTGEDQKKPWQDVDSHSGFKGPLTSGSMIPTIATQQHGPTTCQPGMQGDTITESGHPATGEEKGKRCSEPLRNPPGRATSFRAAKEEVNSANRNPTPWGPGLDLTLSAPRAPDSDKVPSSRFGTKATASGTIPATGMGADCLVCSSMEVEDASPSFNEDTAKSVTRLFSPLPLAVEVEETFAEPWGVPCARNPLCGGGRYIHSPRAGPCASSSRPRLTPRNLPCSGALHSGQYYSMGYTWMAEGRSRSPNRPPSRSSSRPSSRHCWSPLPLSSPRGDKYHSAGPSLYSKAYSASQLPLCETTTTSRVEDLGNDQEGGGDLCNREKLRIEGDVSISCRVAGEAAGVQPQAARHVWPEDEVVEDLPVECDVLWKSNRNEWMEYESQSHHGNAEHVDSSNGLNSSSEHSLTGSGAQKSPAGGLGQDKLDEIPAGIVVTLLSMRDEEMMAKPSADGCLVDHPPAAGTPSADAGGGVIPVLQTQKTMTSTTSPSSSEETVSLRDSLRSNDGVSLSSNGLDSAADGPTDEGAPTHFSSPVPALRCSSYGRHCAKLPGEHGISPTTANLSSIQLSTGEEGSLEAPEFSCQHDTSLCGPQLCCGRLRFMDVDLKEEVPCPDWLAFTIGVVQFMITQEYTHSPAARGLVSGTNQADNHDPTSGSYTCGDGPLWALVALMSLTDEGDAFHRLGLVERILTRAKYPEDIPGATKGNGNCLAYNFCDFLEAALTISSRTKATTGFLGLHLNPSGGLQQLMFVSQGTDHLQSLPPDTDPVHDSLVPSQVPIKMSSTTTSPLIMMHSVQKGALVHDLYGHKLEKPMVDARDAGPKSLSARSGAREKSRSSKADSLVSMR